jgi:hypothetical protein
VKINMPGGTYDPAGARVDFFGADKIPSDSGASAFASTAEAAIRVYRNAEPRWSTFKAPFCAEPVFTPDSNTLKLSKGKTGQLGIYAKAKDGGRATAARWTLSGTENADFSPTSSQDPAPNVSYTVTNAPKGGQIKVTVKFTSTAGVGEKSWTQPTAADEPPAEKFAGSISGTAVYGPFELGEGNSLSADWSGNLVVKMEPPIEIPGFPVLSYNYKIILGSITYSFTGTLNDCHVEGGGPIDLASQIDVSNSVLLTLLQGDPRPYGFFVPMPLLPSANVPGTASECEDFEDEGSIEWPPGIGVPLVTRATVDEGRVLSPDESFSGSASGNNGIGSPAQTWQWSMAPVP